MLNYLKAELYKLLRQRSFCVSLSLLLFFEGLLAVLLRLMGVQWTFNQSAVLLCGLLPFGFFLIYPLSTFVFSEQYKHNTLKNEIFFGLPRSRIYLGKLLSAAITCIFTCTLAIAFFLGASWLLFPVAPGADLIVKVNILGYCLLIALPLWLGALSLLHMLQFSIKNTTVFTVLYIAYFMVFEPLVWLFASSLTVKPWHNAFNVLHRLQLSTPLDNLSGNLTPVLGWAWLVGVGWLVVTTAVGLFTFCKRDIK